MIDQTFAPVRSRHGPGSHVSLPASPLPVRDAAMRPRYALPIAGAIRIEHPPLRARLRIEGDQPRRGRGEVEDAADDEWRGLERGRAPRVARRRRIGTRVELAGV